jgi:hypothetical protein
MMIDIIKIVIYILKNKLKESIKNYSNDTYDVYIKMLEEELTYYESNWQLPQCRQLTDTSKIKQPIFVRYDNEFLVGIQIKNKKQLNQVSQMIPTS